MNLPEGYTLHLDPPSLPMDGIHACLATTYWRAGVGREAVDRAFRNSLCVVVRDPSGGLAAFARMVTDRATFGWLSDVFVVETHRGLARAMTRALLEHADLRDCRRILLATRDAHGVYAVCGFEPLPDPAMFMQRLRPEA